MTFPKGAAHPGAEPLRPLRGQLPYKGSLLNGCHLQSLPSQGRCLRSRRKGLALSGRCVASGIRTPQAAARPAPLRGEPFGGVKTPPYRAVERGRHSARQIAPQTPTGHIHAAPTICRKAGNQILPFPSAGDTIAAPYLYNDPHSRRFVGRGQDPAAGTSRHRSGSCPFFTKADAKKFQQKSNGVRFWAKVLWYFLSRKYRNRNKNKSPHPPAIRQGVGVYTFNILQG